MTAIPRLSVTFDEPVHITTGYSILKTGDFRLVEDHPPLLEMWMSLPLILSPRIPPPRAIPTWELGDRRFFAHHETWWQLPIDTWLVPARIMTVFLGIVLAAFVFRWAVDWFGSQSGLLALTLFTFDPNILAHTGLATLDIGTTALIFITLYTLQRTLKRATGGKIAAGKMTGVGICLGLALASKASAIVLIPITGGLLLLWGKSRWKTRQLLSYGSVYFTSAFLTLWAAHLFQTGQLAQIPFDLPAPTYLRAIFRIGTHLTTDDRRAYLLGQTYIGGHWAYFPVTFLLKTPLPTLILLGLMLVKLPQHLQKRWQILFLASFPIAYSLISLTGQINIGYRHLLPVLPFLYVGIGAIGSKKYEVRNKKSQTRNHKSQIRHPAPSFQLHPSRFTFHVSRFTFYALLTWLALAPLSVAPHYLTFFNELAGGPKNGYRHLADSNVDWGQGLKAVKTYLADHGIASVHLSHFTYFLQPAQVYGIETAPLPPASDAPSMLPSRFAPDPGTYIISASTLRGLQTADAEMYNWFWHRQPDGIIANAMPVYHVPPADPPPTWIAQCTIPATPLSTTAIDTGFGQSNLRQIAFDCTQSWIYPQNGRTSGWYVLHRDTMAQAFPFIREHLALAQLSFEQKRPAETPPLSIFQWPPQNVTFDDHQPLQIAPSDWPPAQAMTQGTSTSAPVALDGPVEFLGYTIQREKTQITLHSRWEVTRKSAPPFSLMAHLLDAEGQPVAIGDRLGIAWDQVQVGDVIVQQHRLILPDNLAPGTYWLQTGAYWLDTLQRLPVLIQANPQGDRLLLTTVEMQ